MFGVSGDGCGAWFQGEKKEFSLQLMRQQEATEKFEAQVRVGPKALHAKGWVHGFDPWCTMVVADGGGRTHEREKRSQAATWLLDILGHDGDRPTAHRP